MKLIVYNFDKFFEENEIKFENTRLEAAEYHKALIFEFGDRFMIADDEACREVYKTENPFELECRRMKEKTEKGWQIFLGNGAIAKFSLEEIKTEVPKEEIEFDDFFDRLHNKSRIWYNFTDMLKDLETAGLTKEAEELRKAAEK